MQRYKKKQFTTVFAGKPCNGRCQRTMQRYKKKQFTTSSVPSNRVVWMSKNNAKIQKKAIHNTLKLKIQMELDVKEQCKDTKKSNSQHIKIYNIMTQGCQRTMQRYKKKQFTTTRDLNPIKKRMSKNNAKIQKKAIHNLLALILMQHLDVKEQCKDTKKSNSQQ